MTPLLRVVVIVGMAITIAAMGYAWWPGAGSGALDVQSVEAAYGDVRRVVSTSGAVRPLIAVEVGSQLSGQIKEIYVDFSSEVRAGQEIARIDPRTFESRLREAAAMVEVAKANLALRTAGVARAEANLRKAQRDHTRAASLAARGTAAEATLDAALAAFDAARAGLDIARAEVKDGEGVLRQRQAALDSAGIDLDRTYIRSPIDGVIIDRAVTVGQTVAASLAAPKLFQIAQTLDHVEIDAQVDEADIGQIEVGNSVTFTVDTHRDRRFDGHVRQIRLSPVNVQNVVTYVVVVAAANPQGLLLPGMTANVEIVTGTREDVVVVPNEALRFEPRGAAETLVRSPGNREQGRGAPGSAIVARMLERAASELGLTPAERAALDEAVRRELAELRTAASAPPSADGDRREQIRRRVARVLKSVLTPAQYQRFDAQQRAAAGRGRLGTVWRLHSDGSLAPATVTLGLADRNVTEILNGDLEPGQRVVVRVRERAG